MLKAVGFAAVVTLGAVTFGQAHAQSYTVQVPLDQCVIGYTKHYVPSTVLVNPRGRLYQGRGKAVIVTGNNYDFVNNPAVYFETRKTIVPDYYSLSANPGCSHPYPG